MSKLRSLERCAEALERIAIAVERQNPATDAEKFAALIHEERAAEARAAAAGAEGAEKVSK